GHRESDGDPEADYTVRTASSGAPGTTVSGAIRTTTTSGAPAWWVGTKGARPWQQDSAQLAFDYRIGATKLTAGAAWARYSVGYAPFETFLRDAAGKPVFSGAVSFDDAGMRRLTLSESNFVNFTPASERDLRAFARLEHKFAGGTVLNANLGQLRHRFRFTIPDFVRAGYDTGPGEHTDQPNERVDLDASLRIPMSRSWVLVTGAALGRASLDRNTADLSAWRDDATRGALRTEGRGTAVNQALFVQSEHFLGQGLTAYAGARYDRFETWGEVIQHTAPAFAQTYDKRSFDRFSPKVALVWEAQPWLSLRASVGSGFRPPALLDLYSRSASPTATAGVVSVNDASPNLVPERVTAFEIGADAAFAGGARGSVTLYRQKLSDLIYRRRLSATLTQTENAAEADVDGVEASLSWPTAVRGLTAFGSLTHQFKYQITRNDAVPESVGKNLTDVPRTSGAVGLRAESGQWSATVAYRYTGRVFASGDDLNQNTAQGVYGAYDAHGIVNAKIGFRVDRNLSFSLALDNLTGREYFVFNRQPGRTVYGELAYRF
ncbi:MAG: TonB-dependent receptor, partial [Burkholderiaceae bacterium]|nr:TonB-dependent receptor [Burkholderiaceae bacterium]